MHVIDSQEAVDHLEMGRLIDAVDDAFRQAHAGLVRMAGRMHMLAPDGAVHIVSGSSWVTDRPLIVTKVNRRWADRDPEHGPPVQGALLVQSGDDGAPLAVIDSGRLTALRTGAVAAVAARYLGSTDSPMVVGSGAVAHACARAIGTELRGRSLLLTSRDEHKARALVERLADDGIRAEVSGLLAGLRRASLVVTTTSANAPLFRAAEVRPGTTILAFGADAPEKQELPTELFARSAVVTDSTTQCVVAGELRHAIGSGTMREGEVRAELASVVAGAMPGRLTSDEIVVFDSTGTAIADIAAVQMILDGVRGLSDDGPRRG